MLYPAPVLLVGSYGAQDRPNLATVAWGGICCSDPPCLSVALRKATLTYHNLVARRAFTVAVPGQDQVGIADHCGIHSGRDGDKFAALGLTVRKSAAVDAPYAEEFPLILECRLLHGLELGLHTMFVGQILGTLIEERVLRKDGKPDLLKLRPIVYAPAARDYFAVGERLGKAFSIGRAPPAREGQG